ncbi:uncharacterized protein BT62DRAFT_932383 [Guyanagaster necrorhizus]|uniref:F-box domain-containing protein n=1 Tax=Guyanagaster necrorhizus TaxID=856835 RepID=A0A9P8AS49_9AGAR|nr:uncharacterized protein BT62DRAFT_932383 [Guyanagaster necrorhizus MCA 3950]KAG7446043.1 hypothetical protein BT62DRAFT_932383 [Guyanagaster necrorhizus MCA 3950]
MSPELPPEILCTIVDVVSSDFNTLSALSLVCKTWLPPSRRVLFKSLVVTPETMQGFLKLFQSPLVSIPYFAQELKIGRYKMGDIRYIDSCILEILAPAIEKLERLTLLRFEHLLWETPETLSLLKLFRRVTSLWLENNNFADIQHLANFTSSFPHLQDLTLIYTVLPPKSTGDDLNGAGVPRGLRRLCIVGPKLVNSIIAWVAASPSPISLRRLELGGIGFRVTPHVRTLLKGAGPHLRELFLRPTSRPFFPGWSPDISQHLDLSDNTELRILRLTGAIQPPLCDAIIGVLSTVNSTSVEEIVVPLLIPFTKEWQERLEDIRAKSMFADVKKFSHRSTSGVRDIMPPTSA